MFVKNSHCIKHSKYPASMILLMFSTALSNTSISEFKQPIKQPIKLCAKLSFVGLENSKYIHR